jgi:hypothetical protein
MKKKKDINLLIVNLFVLVVIVYSLNLPSNIYYILLHNYQERLLSIYGFCEKESFGFVKKINDKYGYKYNIKSYNFDNYPSSSSVFFYKVDLPFNEDQIIILNYDSLNLTQKQSFERDFSNYRILENYKNKCLFLEKK